NALPRSALPTGFAELDAVLPGGGWPMAALSEILLPADGVGELQLLWPLLARLSAQGGRIVLVAPPYVPFAPAWVAAGIALPQLQIVQTDDDRNAMWVAEQCLRSAACAAVVCWPRQGDARTLRRLQLAAETGQCQGFAMRPANTAVQPSMAALRILVEVDPAQWHVLKCRGGNPPARAIPLQSIMLSRAARRSLPLSPEWLHRSGERAEGEGEKPLVREAPRPCVVHAPSPQPSPPSKADGGEGEQPRVLKCRGGNPPTRAVAQDGIEPSPPNSFTVWGEAAVGRARSADERGKPLVREASRSCVVHVPSPQPSPPSEADGGEGEKPPCASVLPLQVFPPLKADGEEGNRCFAAHAS
ncbi:MAG TPA: translesion DNA synthesis-associated protein ImuA, partial [Rhodanobacteraceae bacterium]|nr:translesion DNA synthesis-associated protein ImuA [Rhodanobacteraceae bacterium]